MFALNKGVLTLQTSVFFALDKGVFAVETFVECSRFSAAVSSHQGSRESSTAAWRIAAWWRGTRAWWR